MTPLQVNSFLAFLTALTQLDKPLPANIQAQVNEIGKTLAIDPTQLVNLDIIAEEYEPLDIIYQKERTDLNDAAAQRTKGYPPEPLPTQPNAEITNLARDTFSESDTVKAIQTPEKTSILKRIRQLIIGN